MAPSGRFLAVVSLLAFLAGSSALAGERGLVANSGGVLKAEPKPKAKKGDKLKQGTMVDVTDHSPDGLWVKVAVTGPDGSQEGWVEKSFVRSLSRYGFSWERKDKGGGPQLPTKTAEKPADKTADKPADPAATPAEGGWGNEPVEDTAEGWNNATPAPDAAATPAPDEGWGEADPAASPTPTPAEGEGDGWGTETEVDLTK